MMQGNPTPEYESRLRAILLARDWHALREFSREQNEIPDDVYEKDEHFWMVLLNKIICNRIDLISEHGAARAWLEREGYSSDIGGY
jgi:hypothetical protein